MMTEAKIQEIKTLVAKLYADGKHPSETFGMSWEMLSQMENDHPEITCKAHGTTADEALAD
jgi:hypothetical protein